MTGRPARPHHAGDYARRARHVRAAANANPATVCWRCGEPARHGDPWQAGHIRDSDPTSPLMAEHRSCNTSAGASYGNARREPRTVGW